jgi:hypothetical protein
MTNSGNIPSDQEIRLLAGTLCLLAPNRTPGLPAGFSCEIEHPNNGKRDNDSRDAEAKYKPDVVPCHTLSSLPRWYRRALLRTLGRTHDVFLICARPISFKKLV